MNARTHGKATTGWVVALTGIGSLMAALDTLVVSTALSKIRLDLGATVEQLEWTVNAYNLSFAVLLITGSALGDRYGRRNLCVLRLYSQEQVGHLADFLVPLLQLRSVCPLSVLERWARLDRKQLPRLLLVALEFVILSVP